MSDTYSAPPPATPPAMAAGARERPAPIASTRHTLIVIAILALIAVVMAGQVKRQAAAAGGPHALNYLVLMASEWLLFFYVVRGMKVPLRDVLSLRLRSPQALGITLAWAVSFWMVKTGVLLLAKRGVAAAGLASAAADQQTAAALAPHGAVEITLWVLLAITAGICEETIFRGYLQRQLGALSGNAIAGLVLSGLVFGLAHIYQGIGHVLIITVYGLLFGMLAWASRSLGPGILVHAVEDILGGLALSRATP